MSDATLDAGPLYGCPRCGRERLPDADMTFYSTVEGFHSGGRPYLCRDCYDQVGLSYVFEAEKQCKAGMGNFGDRPNVKVNDGDSVRDIMEELFPDFRPCPYDGCTERVSRYDVKARCRYCQGFYCPAHAGYQRHGCCATL